MPKFLTREEIYSLIQRELPEDVYARGKAPSDYFTTSDDDSFAKTVETVYTGQSRIYANYFPQDTVERIDDWEITVFNELSEASLSLADRIARILAKLRKKPAISMWELLTIAASYVPEGTFVQIAEYKCGNGAGWRLGVSHLGIDTNLGFGYTEFFRFGEDACLRLDQVNGWRLGSSRLGTDTILGGNISWQELSLAQLRAYGYELRVFEYTLPDNDYFRLNRDLTRNEPARSSHIIRQNQSLAAYNLIYPVSEVDQFSGVDTITRDSSSSTGYSGRRNING